MEKSTSQRSMTTGHLLIVMPKLNYTAPIHMGKRTDSIRTNCKPFSQFDIIPIRSAIIFIVASRNNNELQSIKESVDYKNIVNQHASIVSKDIEDSEIPSLI